MLDSSMGNGETAGNWFNGVPGLSGAADIAKFLYNANRTVTSSTPLSLGRIEFDVVGSASPGAFTIQGNSISLASGGEIYIQDGVTSVETVSNAIFLSSVTGGGGSFYSDSSKTAAQLLIGGIVAGRQASGGISNLELGGKGNGTVSGVISDGSNGGKVAVTKDGAGTWTVSGANTYTGTTTITGGTLQIGNGGTSGSLSTASAITNKSVLVFNRSDLITQGSEFSGSAITGSGQITKQGGGVLTLNASNTYQGGTSVQGGTLLVDNTSGSGTGAGPVTVSNAGSVLGGTGIITGSVTIGQNSTLQGGDGSTGTKLSLSGALTLSNNSIVQLTLGANGAHSTLARTGTGTWMFASNQQFNFTDLGAQPGTYENIITGLSIPPNTSPSTWTVTNAGWQGTFSYDSTGNIDLTLITLSEVPEPGTSAAAVLALVAVVFAGRRRALRAWRRI